MPDERAEFIRNLVDEIWHQRISIRSSEALIEKFVRDVERAEAERWRALDAKRNEQLRYALRGVKK